MYISAKIGHMFDTETYVKQKPHIDDEGILMLIEEYVPEGIVSNYRLVMSKEMFVEAYNKFIKGDFENV